MLAVGAQSHAIRTDRGQVSLEVVVPLTILQHLEHLREISVVFIPRFWEARHAYGVPNVVENFVDGLIKRLLLRT